MTLTDPIARAALAASRFGLGARPTTLQDIASDPRGALVQELTTGWVRRLRGTQLPDPAQAAATGASGSFTDYEAINRAETIAAFHKRVFAPVGFFERLVMFWSNHFNMSVEKAALVRGMRGVIERYVIRGTATGPFERMLTAILTQAAMLCYLDNQDSIGPNSLIGLRRGAGVNVNLAREVLELHTLGYGAGYTEGDILQMAYVLSGHSYVRGWEADRNLNGGSDATRGQYIFRADWHEPGPRRLMGRRYTGRAGQLTAVLSDLARHPATAQHLAFKLVQHFLTDTPTPEMVDPIARAYLDSEGDLMQTALALIDLPQAWTLPQTKLRTPYELMVAQARALNRMWHDDDLWLLLQILDALGHRPGFWETPDGFPDDTAHWLSPNGLRIRGDALQKATQILLNRAPLTLPPRRLAARVLGPALSVETATAVRDSTDPVQALTLLFMAPEFQRR
ncbi:DUF1800 domain-containing protein [Pararhodobacter aggregans]|uniref:DUF1800 domain-containing protein n=1 Tax=Pararhodobacter aggregans TaxID=404875 RepID=UPI003A9308D7